VQVREKDVHALHRTECPSERSDAGSSIEHDHLTVVRADLDARGVSTIPCRGMTRGGERPSSSPQSHLHRGGSQKNAAVPTTSPVTTISGIAVTWMCRCVPSGVVIQNASWTGRRSATATLSGSRSGGSGSPLSVCGYQRCPHSWAGISPVSS